MINLSDPDPDAMRPDSTFEAIRKDPKTVVYYSARELCAAGLMAWAERYAGLPTPENFGPTLAAIGKALGMTVAATDENLMKHTISMGWVKPSPATSAPH